MSFESSFTPSPWFWTEGRGGEYTSLRRRAGDVVLAPDNTPGDYAWIDVSEADARLISAAPDLVEALRPFAAAAECDIGEDETDADIFQQARLNRAPKITVGDMRKAAAAIAAALGQPEEAA